MDAFEYRDGPDGPVLHVEQIAVPDIVRAVGTPVYIYSRGYFESRYRKMAEAIGGCGREPRICYAVKANSNLAVLQVFQQLGAGFDIVSGGELTRVLNAGGDPGLVVFSGVGKTTEELDLALKLGIRCFNVESGPELARLSERAALLERKAAVAIRVNPDVDAATHPYISTGLKENKFGVPTEVAMRLYQEAARDPWLTPAGIACHIGSQIQQVQPMLEALDCLLGIVADLRDQGIALQHLDLGGGFGVSYQNEPDFDIAGYGARVADALAGRDLELSIEPGRFLVANGGILVTRVEYLKPGTTGEGRNFAVVDAAMNDLIRPALYQAWHDVQPVGEPGEDPVSADWEVVGPVCESGDFLAHGRNLTLAAGDLVAVHSAGAYAMVLSSNYNSRPRPPEVLVDGDQFHVVRRREIIEDLFGPERLV